MDMWLSWLFKIAGSRTARQPHVIYIFKALKLVRYFTLASNCAVL
jgi:hypothetical protein